MPTSTVKAYAKEKGISIESAEAKWNEAKEKVKENGLKEGSIGYWKEVMYIFKKIMHIE